MQHLLKLHPDSCCDAVTGIGVKAVRAPGGELSLRYVVSGRIGDLLLPTLAAPARADGLWQHTCFEAFVREGEGYSEFNFSPSMQWAAYRFDAYRAGMRPAHEAPHIEIVSGHDSFALHASLTMPDGLLRLGLAAVIEEANGQLSYWALAHPPGKPDFHHSDCFGLELA